MLFDELFEHAMAFPPEPVLPPAPAEGADDGAEKETGPPPLTDRVFPKGGGVYLLTDAPDRMVQLSSAADLRRALRGRLLEPAAEDESLEQRSRRRVDLSQVVRRIRWQPAHSPFELNLTYLRIARRLMPRDYLDHIGFGPCWFVRVDPAAKVPRFTVDKVVGAEGVTLGPVATHGEATRLVQILEDVFDLCRYHHILEQVPHGEPCAYAEMGKCPAPCDGSIPMPAYRTMIETALHFAMGRREELYRTLEGQMNEAAAALAFERAGLIKQRLDRARGIEHAAYRLLQPIESLRYLVVQRAGGRTRVKPFFVRDGRIDAGATVRLKQVAETAGRWIEALKQPPDTPPTSDRSALQEMSERFWLVSHYLFKRETPGLFIPADKIQSDEALAREVLERFEVKRARQGEADSSERSETPAGSDAKND